MSICGLLGSGDSPTTFRPGLHTPTAHPLNPAVQSKATPLGGVVKFAAGGKTRPKKEMGLMTLQGYPDVYVASVCLDANYNQVRTGWGCGLASG